MLKWVPVVLGIAAVYALSLFIDAKSAGQPKAIPVTQKATAIYAPGRLEGATREVELRPQEPGRIVEVAVREGQFVNCGDVLLRIDEAPFAHEVLLAQSQLELAKSELERLLNGARPDEREEAFKLHQVRLAELEGAQKKLGRLKSLRERNAISEQDLDDQVALVKALISEAAAAEAHYRVINAPARPDEIRSAQARIASAEARLKLAEYHLQHATLRAPTDGQVVKVDAEPGELSVLDLPGPRIVVSNTSVWHVRAFVEELDAPRVAVGMSATVTADGIAGKFVGDVVRVSPRMDSKQIYTDQPAERFDTKFREIWIALKADPGFVVGLLVDVVIEANPAEGQTDTITSLTHAVPADSTKR